MIYFYNPATGALTGTGQARICPISGNVVYPAFSTALQPPKQGEKQTVRWGGDKWVLEDITQSEPETEPESELTTEQKLVAIRAERDRLLDSTTWVFQRQQTGTESQKLPIEQYQDWLDYWVALRDFPLTCDLDNPMWPMQPPV